MNYMYNIYQTKDLLKIQIKDTKIINNLIWQKIISLKDLKYKNYE